MPNHTKTGNKIFSKPNHKREIAEKVALSGTSHSTAMPCEQPVRRNVLSKYEDKKEKQTRLAAILLRSRNRVAFLHMQTGFVEIPGRLSGS